MNELNKYADLTLEEMGETAQEVAKEGAKTLKSVSPVGDGRRHYRDGWGVTSQGSYTKPKFVVHNKKKPGLAHLLEHGHALRQGGRAPAIVHIKPVEEWCIKEFEERLARRIEKL
ncbi:MAG: HK97 gp10 family phage protein [Lachnospiraceae bacterium]